MVSKTTKTLSVMRCSDMNTLIKKKKKKVHNHLKKVYNFIKLWVLTMGGQGLFS